METPSVYMSQTANHWNKLESPRVNENLDPPLLVLEP